MFKEYIVSDNGFISALMSALGNTRTVYFSTHTYVGGGTEEYRKHEDRGI